MGRKSRDKKKRRLEKEKKLAEKLKSRPYTKEERNKKINNIILQLMKIGMDHALPDNVRTSLFEFRDNGTPFHAEVELPEYSRILIANFENDFSKDKDNALNFQFKKIRIDGEGDDNPINELNKLQESLMG